MLFLHLRGGGGLLLPLNKILLLMGQSQGQQHTGPQYLSRPFSKRLAYFGRRSFQKSPFDNVRFSAMAVFRQCPKVMIQKVMDFENQLIITSNCVLNDMIYQIHLSSISVVKT